MELREFVKDTLLSIIGGVSDAQQKLVEEGSTGYVGHPSKMADPFREGVVSFDVGLKSEASKDKGGRLEIGVNLGIVEGKGGGRFGRRDTSTSMTRTQYTVPVIYPRTPREGSSEAVGTDP